MTNFKFIKKQSGQSIIEATVAVSIVSLIIVALVSAITVSVRNATYAKNKSLATKYVTEGIEAVRSIRDTNWLTLANVVPIVDDIAYKSVIFSVSDEQWQFSDTSVTPAIGFTRIITLTRTSEDVVEVKVTVSWLSSVVGIPFTTEATTQFSKWK